MGRVNFGNLDSCSGVRYISAMVHLLPFRPIVQLAHSACTLGNVQSENLLRILHHPNVSIPPTSTQTTQNCGAGEFNPGADESKTMASEGTGTSDALITVGRIPTLSVQQKGRDSGSSQGAPLTLQVTTVFSGGLYCGEQCYLLQLLIPSIGWSRKPQPFSRSRAYVGLAGGGYET